MKRFKMSKRSSKRNFKRGNRVNNLNLPKLLYRGGIRL